jgi:hypothetical protein
MARNNPRRYREIQDRAELVAQLDFCEGEMLHRRRDHEHEALRMVELRLEIARNLLARITLPIADVPTRNRYRDLTIFLRDARRALVEAGTKPQLFAINGGNHE